eukprot:IDg22539t1
MAGDDELKIKRSATRISIMTSIYSKKYQGRQDMARYIDEFETLFGQLERMGSEIAIPEKHKTPLLLASMGNESPLESSIAALRLKDTTDLTWEAVSADLIEEWKRVYSNGEIPQQYKHSSKSNKRSFSKTITHGDSKSSHKNLALQTKGGKCDESCGFCGKHGHTIENCFLNPNSPQCRLPKKAIESLKGLNAKTKRGGSSKKISFGSTAKLRRNHKARRTKSVPRKHRKYLDSGASVTMFKSENEVSSNTYFKGSDDTVQLAAGNEQAKCIGQGTLQLDTLVIKNAALVQQLNDTLVSVGQVCDQGNIVVFTAKQAVILSLKNFTVDESKVISVVPRETSSGLYEFHSTSKSAHSALSREKEDGSKSLIGDINLWHKRLAHLNQGALRSLHKHVENFPVLKGEMDPCHACLLGKATKKSFKSHFEEAEQPGEVVHSDLAGPLPISLDGAVYACTFTDQFSRFSHVAGLKTKSDTFDAIEQYKTLSHVTKYYPNGVQRLHTDGGGEYSGTTVQEHTTTTPHTPEHNPFSERYNRTFLESVRVMLEQAGLDAKYWEYALDHAVYIKNRVLHSAIKCTPFEKLSGRKPALNYAKVFGCAAFIYEHAPKSKVHSRASPAILLGCTDNGLYTVERLKDQKIITSVHVTFDE